MSVEPKFVDANVLVLSEKVSEGVYATQSAAVAAAIEQDEAEREVALKALAKEMRARMHTPRSEFVNQDQAFAAARTTIAAARGG